MFSALQFVRIAMYFFASMAEMVDASKPGGSVGSNPAACTNSFIIGYIYCCTVRENSLTHTRIAQQVRAISL